MSKRAIVLGGILAALSVILGAFGAHGLLKHVESGIMDLRMVQSFETAARYQMYHAFALIVLGIIMKVFGESKLLSASMWFFTSGIILFSGSLYLIATRTIIGWDNWEWIGPVTPLGGLCFIGGWIILVSGIIRRK